jgi:hypothetical protein
MRGEREAFYLGEGANSHSSWRAFEPTVTVHMDREPGGSTATSITKKKLNFQK